MFNISSQSPTTGSGRAVYTADEYHRQDNHNPRTNQAETETCIFALRTDPAHHKAVTALRNQHFPQKINKLSAHVALFRALPGSQLAKIEADIEDIVPQTQPSAVATGSPFILGGRHGVAIGIRADPAKEMFQMLKNRWSSFLSKQDQSFKTHYKIQNKVDDQDVPRQTMSELQKDFRGFSGIVEGLSLCLYGRGYWRLNKSFDLVNNRGIQLSSFSEALILNCMAKCYHQQKL